MPTPEPMRSRFACADCRAVENVAAANQRAGRLAGRILAAERAIKQGQPQSVVLTLLGGAEDDEGTT
jgi:hypothetical protein